MTVDGRDFQRLDAWLWCARFLRQRSACAELAAGGMLRINRQPTDKAHAKVRVGDVLTLAIGGRVRVVEVLALAERRGNAAAAQALFRDLTEDAAAHPDPCGADRSAPYPAP